MERSYWKLKIKRICSYIISNISNITTFFNETLCEEGFIEVLEVWELFERDSLMVEILSVFK